MRVELGHAIFDEIEHRGAWLESEAVYEAFAWFEPSENLNLKALMIVYLERET